MKSLRNLMMIFAVQSADNACMEFLITKNKQKRRGVKCSTADFSII